MTAPQSPERLSASEAQQLLDARYLIAVWRDMGTGAVSKAALAVALGDCIEIAERAVRQRQALQQTNKELTVLGKFGTWHDECRPNREMAHRIIDNQRIANEKLADRITELNAEVETLKREIADMTDAQRECSHFTKENLL